MLHKADAVIIGGGIAGASVAFHLARGGLRDIVLLEKEPLLGTGSSAASAGIIYHHLPEKINLQLSQKSMRAVLEFEEEFDTKIDFRRNGCIMTAGTQEGLREIEGIHRELVRMGVDAQMLKPYELGDIFPGIVVDDLHAAIYTPNDGYFDPYGMIQGYASAARKLGAKILTGVPAIGLNITRGKIVGVKTEQGDIATEIVVDASGPSAPEVARLAGIELPIVLVKRQIFVTAPTKVVPPTSPFYFDKEPPFYFRPESGALLMSIAEMMDGAKRDLSVDWGSAEILAERATHRLPSLSSIQVVRGWAGLRSMTPDHTAILGPVPEPSGFYLAAGFTGHGVMHAPITGRVVASMILTGNLDRYEDLDLTPLRYDRFLKQK